MRIITWNCRIGGFRKKASHIAPLRPDILAAQEVESLDQALLFAGEIQPTYRERTADPAFPKRAIGMFSYTGLDLRPVDLAEPMYAFRRYEARRNGLMFQVVAVWPSATKLAKTSYRQAHDGLARHEGWIRAHPTVILGDFNANASFAGNNWNQLLELTNSLGLLSAYHEYFGESFGGEQRPTHFHKGKQEAPFHLDYCFLPRAWTPKLKKVEVGLFRDWNKISDHVPLIVDLDL